MGFFFNIISSINRRGILPSVPSTPDEVPSVSGTISILNVGDSISRGTSDGVGDAVDGTLEEWDGTQMVSITEDVIDANTGSFYPAMAAKLVELGADKLQVVNAGSSGARIYRAGDNNTWTGDGVLYGIMKTKANNYLSNQGKTKFDMILVNQGVNDTGTTGNPSFEVVEPYWYQFIDQLKTDFPNTRLLINNIGFFGNNQPNQKHGKVRKMISDTIIADTICYAGADLLSYPFEDFFDGIHADQPTNDAIGEFNATRIAEIITGSYPNIDIISPEDNKFYYQDKPLVITTKINE
jgi:hypothetical protein